MKPDRFYTLRELVRDRIFPQSLNTLRTVARFQNIDPTTYPGKPPMSWCAIASYPKFVMEGGRWGLYASQIEEHRERKLWGPF